jgi:hypothetical protein
MKLSEYLFSGERVFKKARLLKTIKLDNGKKRKKGDIVDILLKFSNGEFHAEDNEWACKLKSTEFKFIE